MELRKGMGKRRWRSQPIRNSPGAELASLPKAGALGFLPGNRRALNLVRTGKETYSVERPLRARLRTTERNGLPHNSDASD